MRPKMAGMHSTAPGPESLRRRMLRTPTSRLGRLSLVLLGVAITILATLIVAIAAGVRGDSALILEVGFLALPVFCIFASLITAGVAAVVALFRGERSVFLAVPVLLGAFALMFVIGELASSH